MGLMKLSYDLQITLPKFPKFLQNTVATPEIHRSLQTIAWANVRRSTIRKAFNLNLAQSGNNRDMYDCNPILLNGKLIN